MIDSKKVSVIHELMDRYLEIVRGETNKRNAFHWEDSHGWNRDKLRGFKPLDVNGKLPFVIEIDMSFWKEALGTGSLIEYYSDPLTQMEIQLRQKIRHYELFKDNYVYTDEIYIWFGVVTELSIFGSELVFQEHKEGWIKGPTILSYDQLDDLPPPDFRKSGLMPRIHEFYETMTEVADGRMKVMFPELARGPFCLAVHLRGISDLLCDTLAEPESVHKLMRYITDSYKTWTAERDAFLGEKTTRCRLFNDEIDCPSISPTTYDEIIFPYEKELAEHYGGVQYFHSCGNITPFLPSISKLPNLKVCHIGPWTSYEEGDKVCGDKTALEICLHPMNDVLLADEEAMRAKLEDIAEKCPHRNYSVRADTFMPQDNISKQMEKIQLWNKIAQDYFG